MQGKIVSTMYDLQDTIEYGGLLYMFQHFIGAWND